MLKDLHCDTLGDLSDGIARGIINAALRQAINDLEDRGGDEKPRSVTITVTMLARKGITAIDVTAKAALPSYRTDATAAKVAKRAGRDGVQAALQFQDMAPDNPDQRTIDEYTDDDGAAGKKKTK